MLVMKCFGCEVFHRKSPRDLRDFGSRWKRPVTLLRGFHTPRFPSSWVLARWILLFIMIIMDVHVFRPFATSLRPSLKSLTLLPFLTRPWLFSNLKTSHTFCLLLRCFPPNSGLYRNPAPLAVSGSGALLWDFTIAFFLRYSSTHPLFPSLFKVAGLHLDVFVNVFVTFERNCIMWFDGHRVYRHRCLPKQHPSHRCGHSISWPSLLSPRARHGFKQHDLPNTEKVWDERLKGWERAVLPFQEFLLSWQQHAKLVASQEILLWMTPLETPKALYRPPSAVNCSTCLEMQDDIQPRDTIVSFTLLRNLSAKDFLEQIMIGQYQLRWYLMLPVSGQGCELRVIELRDVWRS